MSLEWYADRFIHATFMFATFILHGFYHYSELHKFNPSYDIKARVFQDIYFKYTLDLKQFTDVYIVSTNI